MQIDKLMGDTSQLEEYFKLKMNLPYLSLLILTETKSNVVCIFILSLVFFFFLLYRRVKTF